MKVAFIDNRQWYSPYLAESLSHTSPELRFKLYLPKNNIDEPAKNSKYVSTQGKSIDFSYVWTTYLYPFEIFKRAKTDSANIVHIQWELNQFGNFYVSLLLPFLLVLLHFSNIKCVVTIHSVISRFYFNSMPPAFDLPKIGKIASSIIIHFPL